MIARKISTAILFIAGMQASAGYSAEADDLKQRCVERIANFGENSIVKSYFKYVGWGQIHGNNTATMPAPLTDAYAEISVDSFTRNASMKDANVVECRLASSENFMTIQFYVKPRMSDLPEDVTKKIEFEYKVGINLTKSTDGSAVTIHDFNDSSCRLEVERALRSYYFEGGSENGGQEARSDRFRMDHNEQAIVRSAGTYCDSLTTELKTSLKHQFIY
ncbi:MAG: hypothetical protein M3Q07_02185 [Pseudobdellovibrionaceae bacterium]|nr:hypothetical protein [Pseudobdellovibrionaceae bacterium]